MRFTTFVKPNSKKGPLVVADGDVLTVYLREKPVDGAANTALIKLLANHFRVAKTCVTIKSGQNSRHKIIDIIS